MTKYKNQSKQVMMARLPHVEPTTANRQKYS